MTRPAPKDMLDAAYAYLMGLGPDPKLSAEEWEMVEQLNDEIERVDAEMQEAA